MKILWRVPWALAVIAILFPSNTAWGGMGGRLETIFQADNRLGYDVVLLEEWGDFFYKNSAKGIYAGLTLASRWQDHRWDTEVYQLYMEREIKSSLFSLKVGRFERSDGSGYYTLDGASIKRRGKIFLYELYGGSFNRIEDYSRSVEADLGMGIEGGFLVTGLQNPFGIDRLEGRFGYQRLESGDVLDRLIWMLRALSHDKETDYRYWEFYTGGSFVLESGMAENLLFEIKRRVSRKGLLRLVYEVYEPGRSFLSLRDRFYRSYATGREKVLKGEVHHPPVKGLSIYGKGRMVSLERGSGGYGTTIGASIRTRNELNVGGEVDYLYLEEDEAVNFFISAMKPLTSLTIVNLQGTWQFHKKRTTGENHGIGIEAEMERMLGGDLFFSISVFYIWNSRKDNEYRGGVKIIKYFNLFRAEED